MSKEFSLSSLGYGDIFRLPAFAHSQPRLANSIWQKGVESDELYRCVSKTTGEVILLEGSLVVTVDDKTEQDSALQTVDAYLKAVGLPSYSLLQAQVHLLEARVKREAAGTLSSRTF